MSWPFLHLNRQTYKSSDSWGTLYIQEMNKAWEKLCYTYELPWIIDGSGKSKKDKSRIHIGTYEMKVRQDGPKGWRLELMGTDHREFIQLHRAHHTLYLKGCLVPIAFKDKSYDFQGSTAVEQNSILLMQKIKQRYEELRLLNLGNAAIEISACLPAMVPTNRVYV